MYITTTNDALKTLYREDLMGDEYDPPGVEFSGSNVAQVTESVGERLVEEHDDIERKQSTETDT